MAEWRLEVVEFSRCCIDLPPLVSTSPRRRGVGASTRRTWPPRLPLVAGASCRASPWPSPACCHKGSLKHQQPPVPPVALSTVGGHLCGVSALSAWSASRPPSGGLCLCTRLVPNELAQVPGVPWRPHHQPPQGLPELPSERERGVRRDSALGGLVADVPRSFH